MSQSSRAPHRPNVRSARDFDIQYYYTSQLPGEAVEGVSDVHFPPVEPRQIRVSLGVGDVRLAQAE